MLSKNGKYYPSEKLFKEQKTQAIKVWEILSEKGVVLVAGEERTGKSYVIADILRFLIDFDVYSLIVTTKRGVKGINDNEIGGWVKALTEIGVPSKYYQITYYQHVISNNFHFKQKEKMVFILDEFHKYATGFKTDSKKSPTKTIQTLKKIIGNNLLILSSATPSAQGSYQYFNPFNLSVYSPFPQKNYKDFYKDFCDNPIYIRGAYGRLIEDYKNVNPSKVEKVVKPYIVSWTRESLGLIEPIDQVMYVELKETTKNKLKKIIRNKVLDIKNKTFYIDNYSKVAHTLAMVEGGVFKTTGNNEEFFLVGNKEKINFILENYGDSKDLAIMYYYKAEEILLRKYFKSSHILQSITYSEGVDLHKIKTMIIYSQNFSVSTYIQRRCRQVNEKRKTPIKVIYLLVKNGVSEKIYTTVNEKRKNFTDRVFESEEAFLYE